MPLPRVIECDSGEGGIRRPRLWDGWTGEYNSRLFAARGAAGDMAE